MHKINDSTGEEVWSLTAQGWFSYRAHRGPAPDRIRPRIQVQAPVEGAVYVAGAEVRSSYSCTDAGGSNLDLCSGDVTSGEPLDTSPGPHTFRVDATDRAGSRRSVTVDYHVE